MATVKALANEDIYYTLAKLMTGDDDVDGIAIDDVEADDTGVDVILTDEEGEQRRITLNITAS
jgi:hypothetical protein